MTEPRGSGDWLWELSTAGQGWAGKAIIGEAFFGHVIRVVQISAVVMMVIGI
jgi:hypothetical protein